MKIIFFSHQAEFIYGGEVCTLSFMEGLSKKGVEVHFASPGGAYQERAKQFAICHTVPSRQFSRKLRHLPLLVPAFFGTRQRLTEIIESNGIRILHATSLKAMVYAWALGSKHAVVWHHHDILPKGRANDWWIRRLAAQTRLILVPSRATLDALSEAGVSSGLCAVLPNGFCLDDWSIRPPRDASPKFRVALIGEISPRKGTDRLPGILRSLRERGGIDGIEFVIIGDGLSAPEFAGEMRQILKGQPVTFLGRREDVKQILQRIDLLLVPSRQDPLPTVIVEASLSGVPTVGARVGGIPEMIEHGTSGFLADSDEEYADAIFEARDLSRWLALSQSARRVAEEKFDVRRLTDQLLQEYGKILGNPSGSSC